MSADAFYVLSRAPRPQLAPFIRSLTYARGRIDYRHDRILPNGDAVLMVNLGDPHESRPGGVMKDAWVCGVQHGPLLNRPCGETHVIAVAFRPAGAHAFLQLPLSELTGQVVPLDALWGSFAAEMWDRVRNETEPEGRVRVLEGLLAQRFTTPLAREERIRRAVERLLCSPAEPVSGLADRSGISRKHLSAEFRRVVGTTPRMLKRLLRLQRVLDGIDAIGPASWAGFALQHGFSDQAHLVREFRALTGSTPTEICPAAAGCVRYRPRAW